MSLSDLLRRTLVHYSRCGSTLTLPPADLEAQKPGWVKNTEPFYDEALFCPVTEPDPSYVSFPVLVKEDAGDTLRLIRADTGEPYHGQGMVFSDLSSADERGQVIEAWDNGTLVATAAVSGRIFNEVRALRHRRDQFDALSDYCLLFGEEYSAVEQFLTDPVSAASVFHFLCFAASSRWDTLLEWEELDIPRLADSFNRLFVPRLGLEPVIAEEVLALLEEMELFNLHNAGTLFDILSFCAAINSCSAYQKEGGSLVNTLFRLKDYYSSSWMTFLLQWCCGPERIRQIIREALMLIRRSSSRRDFCEKLLLQCLALEIPLHSSSIEAVCSQLLRGEISGEQRDWIHRILDSPNGPGFHTFIRDSYQQMGHDGTYLQAMACIRSCCAEEKTVQLAQDLMLDSPEESESLLGAAMLTQHLRSVKQFPVTLSREQQLLQKLSRWILAPRSCSFAVAARLVLAMKLTCAADRGALCREDILSAACRAFYDSAAQQSSLCLLGSMPLTCSCAETEDPALFREEVEWQFRRSLSEADFLTEILLFRTCVIAGCRDHGQLVSGCRALAEAEYNRSAGLTPLEKHFAVQTKEELFPLLFPGRIPTTAEAWDCLRGSLSDSSRSRLEKILHTVSLRQPTVLTSSKDVMLVLRYLRIAGPGEAPMASALAEYCTPADTVSDSCLVSWFWILCCWDRRQEAMDFYLSHRDLLDRPWRTGNAFTMLANRKNHAWNELLSTDSRLLMGIYLAALLNNNALVNEFLHSGLLDSRAVNAAADVFTELGECRLPKALGFLSCEDPDMLVNPDPGLVRRWILQCMLPLNPYEFWRICWDDRGITRLVVSYGTDDCRRILDLGYSGDREIVLAALRARCTCIHSIASHFLKDDEIALAALAASATTLRVLQAPVLQDRELVLKLIHSSKAYPPLKFMPDWLCDDKGFVIQSLRKHPSWFFLASTRLRADEEVLMTAMEALSKTQRSLVCSLLQEADPSLRSSRQVMACAVRIYPGSIRMADEVLRADPQLLALADNL